MKQILLVDDDFLSLNAFYGLADWKRYGLRIAYEAHNGREALAYLESCAQLPDAAFIDVCMPDMDGIALLTHMRERYPTVACFMLSSYSDYPYVREALKLGAADYLLKHELCPDGLLKLLASAGLCHAAGEPSEDPEHSLLQALAGDAASDAAGTLLLARYQGERPLLDAQQRSILQTCRHILNDMPGAAVCAPEAGVLALLLPPDVPDAAHAQQLCELLQKALVKYHNARYAFATPRACADAEKLRGYYELLMREWRPPVGMHSFLSTRESAVLTLAVLDGQKSVIDPTLQSLFSGARRQPELNNALLALLCHMRRTLGLPAGDRPNVPDDDTRAQIYFRQQFERLCDQNSRRLAGRYSPVIRDALAYLNLHYAQDIHLGDVACHCHLSYNHLSHLFKKETGDNLISSLNRIRVYHAAHALFFGGASVSAACQSAGFKGYNHFVQTFKAVTGMTPSEFRRSPAAVDWLLSFSPTGPGET